MKKLFKIREEGEKVDGALITFSFFKSISKIWWRVLICFSILPFKKGIVFIFNTLPNSNKVLEIKFI